MKMQHYVERDIEKILLSKEEIAIRVKELGEQISKDYEGKDLIAVGILRGSVVFFFRPDARDQDTDGDRLYGGVELWSGQQIYGKRSNQV